MKKTLFLSILAACSLYASAGNPKREFRGAWLHTVYQSQYAKMSPAETRNYLCEQLDLLKAAGCNAILFQVRPSADAFYPSKLEPWSRFLTGTAGQAPSPEWDPLQFMIEESHARGMELHAWLNPYRVTTSKNEKLPAEHLYHRHPERFVTYADDKMYFDPGYPENREFINEVVKDIITRYDVDAIHLDDYFYPYPVDKKEFPDSKSYAMYGNGMDRNDWRRHNVDLLIEGLYKTIHDTKPWVRLGISPFGVWRNKSNDPRGSETQAFENYSGLFADVLLWSEKGWVDYMLPQLYWELEKKVASSEKLAYWWNDNANGRHMYIGQSVERTMNYPDLPPSKLPNQLEHKIKLSRSLENIQGNCWWPGYSITANYKGIADELGSNYQHTIALVPSYPWIDDICPDAPTKLRMEGNRLTWDAPSTDDELQKARAYVVYRFAEDEPVDLNDPEAIQAVTYTNSYSILTESAGRFRYAVTTLDRVNNESQTAAEIVIEL